MTDTPLAQQTCYGRKAPEDCLSDAQIKSLLPSVPGWQLSEDGKGLHKDFSFKDFYHTLGFITAVGWMANQQDHHPDIEAGYGHCRLFWSTHDVDGLSMNDFICAARSEALAAG